MRWRNSLVWDGDLGLPRGRGFGFPLLMAGRKPVRPEPLLGSKHRATKDPHFPMKFKEGLRRFFGGRLHGERLHLFKKYLRFMFKEQRMGLPYSSEMCDQMADRLVDKMIADLSPNGFNEARFFFEHLHNIPAWRKQNRIQQRRDAARGRWEKKKVDPPKRPRK